MSKKIQAIVKLQVNAGKANPSPPIGPSLGQQGVNIMAFCKEFNEKTAQIESGLPIPVVVTIYSDRSFTFITKSPPASVLLKKIAGISKGSSKAKKEIIGKITNQQILDIAKQKISDMTGSDIYAMSKSIKGTAESMGLSIED